MANDSNDPLNVYGLGALVNPARSNPNSSDVEHSFMGNDITTQVSAADEFRRRIANIERETQLQLGISAPRDNNVRPRDDDFEEIDHEEPQQQQQPSVTPPRIPIQLGAEGMRYTEEAMKSDRVSSALSSLSINPDNYLSAEHENDEKLSLIEEINDLVSVFKEAGEDISSIRIPSIDDPIEIIRGTLHSLIIRNDRKRYGSLADDCIMLIATSVAQIFNGDREWFGFKPDLSGWPQHLRPKLRRMRHDTAQVTGSLLNNYHFGVGGRILLELVPSMITYARDHSGANKKRDENVDFAGAIDRLRDTP
jgi:hypothetical protein